MRQLVFLLFLLSLSFAACEGEVSMRLPAISEGTGLLVGISMKGIPGEGVEYVGTDPTVGTGTQESLTMAAGLARALAGGGEGCDLLVRVDTVDSPGGVEGPSAGAAFAVMAYSLFSGEEMRGDATITGGVTEEGNIYSVGGLYEKALSAKMNGIGHFVTPLQSVEEKLMLRGIGGVEIHEAVDLEDAIGFFFYGEGLPERPMELELEPLGNLTPYGGERVPGMGGIVDALISSERAEIAKIGDVEVREYFEARAAQHEELYGLGYDYAAANGAFLTQITAAAIAEVDGPDFGGKKAEVEECLGSLQEPEMTVSNYEWVMGGEAREVRARRNYDKYGDLEPETKDEEYLLVYQLGYSKAWCEAAAAMYAAGGAGEKVDSQKLRDVAEELLDYSDDYGDWEEYAQTGRDLYDKGKYAGAVYELAFAKSMVEGDRQMEDGASEGDYLGLMENESTSLWGRVFRGHAEYMDKTGSREDAYRMAVFAKEMDGIAAEMAGGTEEVEELEVPEDSICMPAFVVLGACCAALFAGEVLKN